MITRAVEDYLKAIYKLQQDSAPATTNAVAERMGLRAASVTAMLQQLARQGLVDYKSHRGASLTEVGLSTALRVIRRHRLIELYLNQHLGVPWDRVHDEAERLEHAISPYLEERIDATLGYPGFDPHGAPIPSTTGVLPERHLVALADLPLDTPSVVRHIPDDNPDLLRCVASLGIVPDAVVTVRKRDAPEGFISLSIAGPDNGNAEEQLLSEEMAQHVFVSGISS